MIDDKTIQTLLRNLLNINVSNLIKIDSVHKDSGIDIFVYLKFDDITLCPTCSTKLIGNGYYKRKVILPYSPFESANVFLKFHRKRCPRCNRSFNGNCSIFPENKKLSYSSIQKIMKLLEDPSMTFMSVSKIIDVSPATVMRTFDANCHIPRIPFPEVLCIDEVYTKNNSYNSKYSCIFYDFEKHTVIDVLPCRKKNYLSSYLTKIPKTERNAVKYVCIDMYRPYKDIVHRYFKKAIICVDSFHVVKHLNDDLNKIRIRLYKQYSCDSIEYYLLKHFKFLLFDRTIDLDNKGKYNKKLKRHMTYRDLLDAMLSINDDLEEGYRLKELYINFNKTFTYREAKDYMDTLIDEFKKQNIKEFEEFIELLTNWKDEIVNSFIRYNGERINNGIAESMNETVALLMYNTKGIRDAERRRKRIMYSINKKGFVLK